MKDENNCSNVDKENCIESFDAYFNVMNQLLSINTMKAMNGCTECSIVMSSTIYITKWERRRFYQSKFTATFGAIFDSCHISTEKHVTSIVIS